MIRRCFRWAIRQLVRCHRSSGRDDDPFHDARTLTGGYDTNGRLANVTYPSGFVAHYAYNALGYSNQMSDGTTSVHWTLNALDAEQHITQQTAGNGVVTTRSFDAATGRLVLVQAGGSNSVQNHAYTYNLLGNPLSRTDANTGLSESFTYDALNRLTSATLSTSVATTKTFAYSAIGNLISKSDVGTYSYPSPGQPRRMPSPASAARHQHDLHLRRQRQPDLGAGPHHHVAVVQQARQHHRGHDHHQLPGRTGPPALQAGDAEGTTLYLGASASIPSWSSDPARRAGATI